jgi:hypothetical protein
MKGALTVLSLSVTPGQKRIVAASSPGHPSFGIGQKLEAQMTVEFS